MDNFRMYADCIDISVKSTSEFGKPKIEIAMVNECNTYGDYERLYAKLNKQEAESLIEALQKVVNSL